MSKTILVLGRTGTGKSRSVKNLNPETTAVIQVVNKGLPFKGAVKKYVPYDVTTKTGNLWVSDDPGAIVKILRGISEKLTHFKTVIVDDLVYVMVNNFMKRIMEKGYDKYNELAEALYSIMKLSQDLRDDLTVIFLTHSDQNEFGEDTKMRTLGKLTDDKIIPEALFTIVLLTQVQKEGDKYKYMFRTNGSPAKSPEEMFSDLYIENDLQLVLDKINEYYKGE